MDNSTKHLLFIAVQVIIILVMMIYVIATVHSHCTDPSLPSLQICY